MTLWTGKDGKERAKYGDEVVAHRNLVIGSLRDAWAGHTALQGAVAVKATLTFKRPRGHYGTGRNSAVLKDSAPVHYTGFPDGDKGMRLAFDALTIAGVIEDDSNVARGLVVKQWGTLWQTLIEVWALDDR